MKIKVLLVIPFILLLTLSTFAQNGGKAEPNRITFAKGKSSAVRVGTLKGDEQYEYVFGAKKGQRVKLILLSMVPRGKFHSFKVLGADPIDFASEYDKNYAFEFTTPETGDYLVFVSFNGTSKVKSGKFDLTLMIKD